jgi:hypothetical protein
VDIWWWVPIGLAAWFLVAVVVAMCIGPVLRRSSQTLESLDQRFAETSDGHGSPGDERHASQGRPGTGATGSKPVPAARRAPVIPPSSGGADPHTLKRNSTRFRSRSTSGRSIGWGQGGG